MFSDIKFTNNIAVNQQMYEFKTVLSFLYDPADGRVAVYGIHFFSPLLFVSHVLEQQRVIHYSCSNNKYSLCIIFKL
jgi:hypothetical protein